MPKIVDHDARRAELTRVAVRLISDQGLEGATIREIAAQSGYSKGVVEHYFENKEDLISAALEAVNVQYRARAEAASAALRGLAAIRACLRVTLPLTAELRREWRVRLVFWSAAATDPVLRRQQGARFRRAAEHFATHFQQALDDGEIAAVCAADELGRRLVNNVSGLSVAALHNSAYGKRDFLEREIEFLINGVVRGGSP